MSPRLIVLTAAVLVSAGAASPGLGYDTDSHEFLGVAAAQRSAISERLQQDLGLSEGRQTRLRAGKLFLTVEDWVGHGAREEDLPFRRVLNHFHNPLRPWRDAGLSIARGDSSVLWSQAASQSPGGTWTWAVARRAFLGALTLSTPDSRERRLAETFDTLGHLTHLVQDASVPAHTRNDAHPSIPLPFLNTFIPLNPDWYEDWLEDLRLTNRAAFDSFLALSPTRPLRLVLHSSDPAAPVGIAGLIDTDQVMADGPAPSILGAASAGIAEFTNANFLSRDTLFSGFSRPSVGDLGPGFYEDERGAFRQYFPKVVAGTTIVEVPHFAAEAALTLHLKPFGTAAPQRVMWRLTPRVHEDYARELIPRAIGYSAELIDYFFRGRLDVDLSSDSFNPALVRVSATNASSEPLFQGTLTLYADTADGQRVQAPAIDASSVVGIAAGAPLFPVRFEPPPDAERFVAVYQGALGLERPGDDFPGAVIGKVIGGLRVEEVFAQGDRWRLRTPRGVFDLPLTTATYDEVKWGDGDHVLVARTPLDADVPFVDTFEVVRRAGSIEPVLSGPSMVVLRPLGTASLAFASAPLVTTITVEQTTAYRQQIGRYREVDATRWVDGSGNFFYESVSRTTAPIAFETVHAQDVVFAATVPVRLDAGHNLDLGTLDDPYYWFLADVTADRDGRILGLAVIALTEPPVASATVPWFRLDNDGQAFAASTITLGARFPENMTTIWALVDLGSGEIVAATAEPAVRVNTRHASEGPPWDTGGASFNAFPGVYRDVTTIYAGGPRDGQADRRVDAAGLGPRGSATGILAHLDAPTGAQALTVAGWFRPEIKSALTRSGLGAFDAGEVASSVARWNYACVATICTSSDDDYAAFEVRASRGGVLNPPAEFIDARRARPAPVGERLVLMGDAFRTTFRPVGSVVVWDIAQGAAREALAVPDSFHDLGGQAATSAVLLSYRPRVGTRGTFLVPLDEGGVASFFANEELLFDFAMVGGDQLYSVRDFRFYRAEPPLRATPLPARFAPLSPNPAGDYHAIRVP